MISVVICSFFCCWSLLEKSGNWSPSPLGMDQDITSWTVVTAVLLLMVVTAAFVVVTVVVQLATEVAVKPMPIASLISFKSLSASLRM